MSANTSIQWTDRTWNPVRGCSRVSAGCENCYAMNIAHRFSGAGKPFEGLTTIRRGKVDWAGVARFIPEQLGAPLKWRKPQRVFVNSMSDLFHPSLSNEEIAVVFGVMAACPEHTFQVLTKQPKRAAEWFKWVGEFGGLAPYIRHHAEDLRSLCGGARIETYRGQKVRSANDTWCKVFNAAAVWSDGPLSNVHLGVSAENQETWNARLNFVHGCPAATHFASLEPLLGPIDLRATGRFHLDWVIVGGESGPGARPCDLAWIKDIVQQCNEVQIPCFVKQLGARTCITEAAWRAMSHGMLPLLSPRSEHAMVKAVGLVQLATNDRAGGDPSEWPESLRVRQFPEAR